MPLVESMNEGDQDPTDFDRVLNRIRTRVDMRRQQGFYPRELDSELTGHFANVAERMQHRGVEPIDDGLARIAELSDMGRHRIDYSSTVLGGTRFHRAVAKVAVRQTEGILRQTRELAEAVLAVLEQLARSQSLSNVVTLEARVDAALERLATLERTEATRIVELERRVAALEARMSSDG